MNEQQGSRPSGATWVPAWTIVVLVLAAVLREGTERGNQSWILAIGAGALGLLLTGLITAATDRGIALAHRLAAVVGCSYWMTLVAYSGWSLTRTVAVLVGAGALFILEAIFAPAVAVAQVVQQQTVTPVVHQEQTDEEAAWQALLRRLAKAPITVRGVRPWADAPQDGMQVHIDLPEGLTVKKLSDSTLADDVAGAVKLPQGCVVRILDADHQGAAILDVMLRDCLADERLISEPTTAASIYDEMDVATTPRGEPMTVCLREKGMIVGGTTGSGKTTLLHRIIMRLARCIDALIWVIDPNGGGVAGPWLTPFARGEVDTPTIDWVAEDEVEAAVMCAIAIAIAKDRKTNRFSMRRKRQANTTVLPVDKDMPAIVIITDEGGEIRQAIGLLAALVDQYIARIAQIGRAEGVRVIQSVLRGTSDLLEKSLRAVQGIRVCLRMDEEGEYDHVLGKNPGRVRLLHKGSAFIYRTDRDYRPVLGRTVNVDIASIERHAIATAHLRPKLDDRGKLIASRVTLADVLDGRDPNDAKFAPLLGIPVIDDVLAGVAYENRWKRKAAMLAQLRDEDLPEDDEPGPSRPAPTPTSIAKPGSALDRLARGAGVAADAKPTAQATQQEPAKPVIPSQQQPEPPAVQQPTAPDDVDAVAEALLSDAHMAVDAEPVRPRIDAPTASAELVPASAGQAPNTRQSILLVVHDEHPTMLTATQIRTAIFQRWGVDVSKQRVGELLGKLVEQGELVRDETRPNGPYYGLAD
ncbi:hypothetical protein [Micromonospora costi]|uniref:FtsK domain-containing protein n=1 Tax=Micromonospora costi TaxID=1530042 RepID=A0A3B0AA88_9ACTN|nr:hypothetical protein [Micromonospora costi]RKN55977.1 hypothetical protein D7193_15440 [Micromonospora costi]